VWKPPDVVSCGILDGEMLMGRTEGVDRCQVTLFPDRLEDWID
jgi:hypothetical protein